MSYLSVKAMTGLKSKEDYFVVTSSVSGLINNNEINFKSGNIWELHGNKNYK